MDIFLGQPRFLKLTWGDVSSILELRLTSAESETILEIEQSVPIEIARSGAGALWVGPGWDGALLGLGLHLSGESPADPVAAANSLEVQRFSARPAHAWAETITASGTATPEEVAAGLEVSLKQFAPDLPAP